ncbi:serine/threonine-protein phosphatase 6 regulatory ankyrin repeat subunit C-like [Chelonus insularis]|uniref:serine/threonine-protein phosphatase 6 regulatory ankyrin repeat subunit C-like n=1 Tax=Chelonus insularis TaxID=460826 RepID=UPI0015887907|nr:serine/threonine-protein phosphatase 6 regulatory ankyrin repeat subunit C-like [Chelonus insularis]
MAHVRQNGHLFLRRAIKRSDKNTAINLILHDVGINDAHLNDSVLLHYAIIKFDDLDIVNMLLDKGANIHAKDKYSQKPLHIAIQNNKTEAALLLIRKGALVKKDLKQLLLTAIQNNNHTIFEMLINQRMQCNPSDDISSLIDDAIFHGNPKIIKHILPHCQFLESTNKYIPKRLVIKSDLQCKESVQLLLNSNFIIHPDCQHDTDFIYAAAENGHQTIVLQLLRFGIDVNMVNSKTRLNLLTIACLNKHHEIVEHLLLHGAQVNEIVPANYLTMNNGLNFFKIICDFNHFLLLNGVEYSLNDISCLHIAVCNSDQVMTEMLLKSGAKIANDPECFFITCLAAQIGSESLVRVFLNHGLKVNFTDIQGKILLHSCIYANNGRKDSSYDVVNFILKKGANFHLHAPGNTFVFDALNNGHRRIAQLFLQYEPDISYVSPNGDTALHIAIESQFNAEFIITLLKLKSPVDAINSDGLTPLFVACKIQLDNQFQIITALLQYKANVNCTDITFRTPLHSVCHAQNYRLVQVLLENGANPNAQNDEGQTPLHIICKVDNNSEIIKLLMAYKVDIDAVDAKGWTPLFVACYARNERALQCLLDYNANPNHTDLKSLTALHIAVEQKSIEMTKYLLKCGANITSADKKNQTALQIAVELYRVLQCNEGNNHRLNRMNNCKEIIKILKTEVVKLVVAGFKVNDIDWKIVYDPDYPLSNERELAIDIWQLDESCQQEIDEMKQETIGTSGITFDNLLKKPDYFLRRFMNNEDIEKTLKKRHHDRKYPLYIDIICGRFRDVKYRYEITNSAKKYFRKKIYQKMPDEYAHKILSYLNFGDLKMFLLAMKPVDGIREIPELFGDKKKMSNLQQNSYYYQLCEAIVRKDKARIINLIMNNARVNIPDSQGNTPLHWAIIKFDDLEIMKMLLNEGADIYARNHNYYTPLNVAIQNHKKEAVSLLIEKGALNEEDLNASLLIAIGQNDDLMVKMLIDYGMKYNLAINFIIPLNAAITQNRLEIIKLIIPHCPFLNSSNEYIPRDLVMKSGPKSKECMELLMTSNFTIDPISYSDNDFIYAAVENGHLPIVIKLLEHGIDVNMMNTKTGLNLLLIACLNKHYEIIEKLLEHHVNVNVSIPASNERLNNQMTFSINLSVYRQLLSNYNYKTDSIEVTCLHITVFNSDWKTTQLLLRYGAKIENDPTFSTIIRIAVHNNCKELVSIFLDQGVSVNDIDPLGNSLLHFCIYFNPDVKDKSYNVVKLLLERGANTRIPGQNIIFQAMKYNHHRTAQLLLDYNADTQYIGQNGDTLLHIALQRKFDVRFIETLLKLNSSVNFINNEGITPLMIACRNLSEQLDVGVRIIDLLLHYGANVNCDDHFMMTPLHFVCNISNLRFIKSFLVKGANVNARNYAQQTPLHIVCTSRGDVVPRIELLLEYGANIEAVNNRGQTPLSLACHFEHYEVIQCLLNHYANPNHIDSKNLTPLHIAIEKMIYYSRINSPEFCRKFRMIIKAIVSQRIKLKTAGLELKNQHSKIVYKSDEYITIDNRKYYVMDILQLNVASCSSNYNMLKVSNKRNSIDDISQLESRCEQELEKIKEEKIGIDDLTFYHLLKGNIYILKNLFENDEVQQKLQLQVYDEKFPLYINIIRNRFRNAKNRYERYLLEISAKDYFRLNINQRLPDECIMKILSYLHVKELNMFISTMKNLN